MNIYKNFLNKEDFNILENFIMSNYMPWYFTKILKSKDVGNQFEYCFILDGKVNCSDYMINIINPIFKKLKYKEMNRVKANFLLKDDKIKEHGMHVDQNNGKTGIFYINTCNGYTKFENGKKIKSEKNKYVEFDSTLKHTGSTCTDEQRRVVINFNYQ